MNTNGISNSGTRMNDKSLFVNFFRIGVQKYSKARILGHEESVVFRRVVTERMERKCHQIVLLGSEVV